MVRELDLSRITLRLVEKSDKKGGSDSDDHVISKLSGELLPVLQRSLVCAPKYVMLCETNGI